MTAFPTGGALTADTTLGTDAMISAARPIMTWVSLPIVRVTSKVRGWVDVSRVTCLASPWDEIAMALPANPIRYIVTLSVPGGWPDQSTELRPADMERELRSIFGANITVRAARITQSPGANVARYFELEADGALPPTEIKDMLVVAIERIGAGISSEQEVRVALASSNGESLAEGSAKPQPR